MRWREKGWPVGSLYTDPQPTPDVSALVDLLRDIGDVCRQLEMPSERAIAEWADRIDDALAACPKQQSTPTPWVPVLKNRADGVDGHFAIGRFNPLGYWEFWNLVSHNWASASDGVLTLDEANNLLREITLTTSSVEQQPMRAADRQENVSRGWRSRFLRLMGEMQSELDDSNEDPIPSEMWSLWRELLDTAPQPVVQKTAPDVSALIEALEQVVKAAPSSGPLWHGSEQIVEARAALVAHRKGGEE